MFIGTTQLPRVCRTGASAGSVLVGLKPRNEGLRLNILQEQDRGYEGPLRGPFVLLDAGSNPYADILLPLVGQQTDARAVLDLIRRKNRFAVNVVNANLLGVEKAGESRAAKEVARPPACIYFTEGQG